MKRLVIFDFDGTLTRRDTFLTFPLMALGRWTTYGALISQLPVVWRWRRGSLSNSEAKELLTRRLYGGMNKALLTRVAEHFEPEYREDILAALRSHQRAGDEVCIVSASLDIWLRPIAEKLGVKLLCTQTATDSEGNLTGRFSTPNCHGEEKLTRLRQAYADLDSYEIIAYGDSPNGGDAALRRIANTFHSI